MTATSPVDAAPDAPVARLGRWTGVQLDPRTNSLNLMRLVLASLVLVAHGYYISGVGVGPHIDGENLGGWAVFGFFAISGYLITGSRWSTSFGTFLVHRLARIFPAFLVCLVLMAALAGPIGYLHVHGSLGGYLTAGPTPPAAFVFSNALLRINAYDIAGTPAAVPYPGAWNGSLWSLYYEFLCYLVVGGLGLFGVVRRSPWVLGATWLVSVLGHAGWSKGVGALLGGNADAQLLLKLLPIFLGGALVNLLRHRLPLHWAGAVGSLALIVPAVWLLDGWGAQLTAPAIAYLSLWLGSRVPSPGFVQKHDISYGVYIYAFPVQQLLVLTGIHTQGLVVYDLVAFVCTVPLAAASWLLVERPVMRAARGRRAARVAVSPAPA